MISLELPASLRGLFQQATDPRQRVDVVEANLRRLYALVERGNQSLLTWANAVNNEAQTAFNVTTSITADYRRRGVYWAKIGDYVRCDTTDGNVSVILPEANPENAGRSIIIVNDAGSNTVIVTPVEGTVHWLSSMSIGTHTARHWVSNGAGNWSQL